MAKIQNVENWLRTGREAIAPAPPPAEMLPADQPPLETAPVDQPPVETPPANVTPPIAPVPAAPPDGIDPNVPNAPYRAIRKLQQEIRELKNQRQQPAPAAAAPVDPNVLPDLEERPVENLDGRIKRLEGLVNQYAQSNQVLLAEQQTMAQELNYRSAHPEYDKATKYLEESENKIWEKTGGLTVLAARLLDQNEAYFDRESRLRGVEPEDLALQTAKNQIAVNGRAQLAEFARSTGKSYPQVVVDAAEARGYNTKPPEAPRDSAQRRVQASIERGRAESLSTMSPNQPPAPTVISDKQSLDEFLQTADPEARARFIQERDTEDPDWLNRMFAR